jgi:hypothetical protein
LGRGSGDGVKSAWRNADSTTYDKALDNQLPDDVRRVIIAQLKEIEATADWIQSQL